LNEGVTLHLRQALAATLQRNHPGVSLRVERDDDLDFLRALYAQVRAQELAAVDWPEARKREFTDGQFALQSAHYRQHYAAAEFLVIEQGAECIGRLYLCVIGSSIRIMDIALVEARRGQGLGSTLLIELLRLAKERELDVTLHVEPDNPAQRLYSRLGFTSVERRGIYDFLRWSP
jgi:ribosomal protein S18 acetylase RimI-like enzyme